MRVGYDEQVFLAQRHGGISRYVVSLVEAFQSAPSLGVVPVPGWRWSDNQHSNDAGLSRRLPLPELPGRLALATQGAYFLANGGRRRAARGAQILHHTYFHPRFTAPRSPAAHVCTVYDMIPELYPESFPMRDPHLAKRQYVESCAMVFCISDSARRDLIALYGDPGVPMPVTHLGVGPEFRPGAGKPTGVPSRYVLFVGRRGGYKDFDVLAEAVAAMADPDVALVVVGGGDFEDAETERLGRLGLTGRTHRINARDDELTRLYGHALAFVFPSRHEGFGLPTLEAMASGAPVVLADSSSHPEVGGEVARYFPVGDAPALTALLDELVDDERLRTALGEAGVLRAATFTWEATARATAGGYRTLAST